MNYLKIFSVLLTVFLFSACSTSGTIRLYEGKEKKKDEIAILVFPISLDLLEVDGKKMSKNLLIPDDHFQLQLLPGKHFLKLVYSEYWGTERVGNNETSEDFYFAIETNAGELYKFEHNGPENLVNAKDSSSISDIKIWAINKNTGAKINQASSQSFGNFLANSNNKIETIDKKAEKSTMPQDISMHNTVETQLKYWWNLATNKQRELFKQWMNSQ